MSAFLEYLSERDNPSPPKDLPTMTEATGKPADYVEGCTPKELRDQADKLEAQAKELRKQASNLRQEELKRQDLQTRLVYAARDRCPCGAGLAYDPCHEDPTSAFKGPSYWDCSAILLGTADTDVTHTGRLPFTFYEFKSENQPSAYGATTRPKADA